MCFRVVAAHCGFDGGGGAAGLGSTVVCSVSAGRWCSVSIVLARPFVEWVPIFPSEAGLAGVCSSLDHLVPVQHLPLAGCCWVATRRPTFKAHLAWSDEDGR